MSGGVTYFRGGVTGEQRIKTSFEQEVVVHDGASIQGHRGGTAAYCDC